MSGTFFKIVIKASPVDRHEAHEKSKSVQSCQQGHLEDIFLDLLLNYFG